ncbi:lactate utilization protein [Candidatus Woesearchaeota archaeon]|nr:lactate utilization protein [Candidatus Woesearchaeota archaeon]
MDKWKKLSDKKTVEKTIKALKENNIEAYYFNTSKEAKKKIFEIIPEKAEIMNMTSVTLETMNVAKEIQESNKYIPIRNKLMSMDRKTQSREMQKLGSSPDYAIGSVHAVTEKGEILIASNTGSQLPAYSYGSDHVIFVVGTQKIVKNTEQGIKRIYEYSLPLESERAKKAYGVPGSFVSKILIINREIKPGRIIIIFINENLGF